MPKGKVWKQVWRSGLKMGVDFLVWNRVRIWRTGRHTPSTLSCAEAPAGYPYKNSDNRKNRKRAGDDCFPRALFFFSPASPQHKEASAKERAPSKNSQEYPTGLSTPLLSKFKKIFKDFSRTCTEIQVIFLKKFKDFSRLCESCLKKPGAKMVELSKVHHWPHLSNENKRDISV